jgi:hypothetical protein
MFSSLIYLIRCLQSLGFCSMPRTSGWMRWALREIRFGRKTGWKWAINKAAGWGIWGIIKDMPYILEHLTSLRQEITDLRNMNARSAAKSADSQIDQSAVEMRANRLVEIKKELSQMLNRPEDPAVWWEKGGRRRRIA